MTYYIGINKGHGEYSAAHSTSATTSKDVEVVVNNTNVTDRAALVLALNRLKNYILRQNFPL